MTFTTTLESKNGTAVQIGSEHPFAIIGERINPTGRSMLTEELIAGDMTRVRADALAQVAAGARVLDINAGVPGYDEAKMLSDAVRAVQEAVDVPVCIDTSTFSALEPALMAVEGKPLINSVTGEDESLELILPLVKKYGTAVIGMANDDSGISMDVDDRFKAAKKIVDAATDFGIPREDVIIDPLAMTVGAIPDAGRTTLATIRRVHEELGVNLSCGASNMSFGLPDRHAVDAAFLPMAIFAGMHCAITNPLADVVRKSVLAADVLLGQDEYSVTWIKAHRAEQAAQAG